MSDLTLDVTWREFLDEAENGNVPHCIAVASPLKWHDEIIETLSQAMHVSSRDLIVIGSADKAPSIGDPMKPNYEGSCRWLIDTLPVKPFESKRRLAVIRSADKLLLPAANSLLKIAEEPPEHAVLLFLMEDGRLFLPTLKSRSRFIVLTSAEKITPKRMPMSNREWLEWLKAARKNADSDSVAQDLDSWCEYELKAGNITLSQRINRLKILSSRKNLSVPMLCDVIILALREETCEYEYILDDIWQA